MEENLYAYYNLDGDPMEYPGNGSVSVRGQFPSTVSDDYFFSISYDHLHSDLIWRKEGYTQLFLQNLSGTPLNPYNCPIVPGVGYKDWLDFAQIDETKEVVGEGKSKKVLSSTYIETEKDIFRMDKTAHCKFGCYEYFETWENGRCCEAEMVFSWDGSQDMEGLYREHQSYKFTILAIFGDDNLITDIKVTCRIG